MKVYLILGLPRSGTTFLQSHISRMEKVVGLGEVLQTVRALLGVIGKGGVLSRENTWNEEKIEDVRNRCRADKFWSVVYDNIEESNVTSVDVAVRITYETAGKMYPGYSFVDSSKHVKHIENFEGIEFISLKPIVCFRHPIAWFASIEKYNKRMRLRKGTALLEYLRWYYSYSKIIKGCSSYEYVTFFYDRFVIKYLGCGEKNNFECIMHEMIGSRTFHQSSNEVIYDHSWIIEYKVSPLSLILYSFLIFPLFEHMKSMHEFQDLEVL
jgi:hypothetical protein